MKKYAVLIALALLFIAGCGEGQFINRHVSCVLQEKGSPDQISPDGYGGTILTYIDYREGTSYKHSYFVDSNGIVYNAKTPLSPMLRRSMPGKALEMLGQD
jgi:hypothetical protein